MPHNDEELIAAAGALGRLAADKDAFFEALGAHRHLDPAGFAGALDRVGVVQHCKVLCDWVCSKECVRVCVRLAGPVTPNTLTPDVREWADVTARLAADPSALTRVIEAIDGANPRQFKKILDVLDLAPFAHLICFWVCSVRCRLRCRVICRQDDQLGDLVKELIQTAEGVRRLAADPRALKAAIVATRAGRCDDLQQVITRAGLSRDCFRICWWLCSWRCVLVCVTLCRRFLDVGVDFSDEEMHEFAHVVGNLADRPETLRKLADAVGRTDERAFAELVAELGLQRFCIQLCHWLCAWHCHQVCICVCRPLIGRIDHPSGGACAQATAVPACSTTAGPLVGVTITGTASGAGFDHYTLRYSWGANPPVQTAVVYPDCGRPPGTTSSTTPVTGGTLGWLDVTLLPPGITSFTVHLDVFDGGGGSVSDTATFEIRTEAVEITAVAKVEVLDAADPFHPGTTVRLIKDVNDASTLVPETAIGGSVTADGSAYVVGCDRILSQFVLARFDAPPASPPPTPADAGSAGGTNLIVPVPYEDVPAHPWQSGCFGSITPNTILNGNLVAVWGQNNCTFGGFSYKVPKVKGTSWPTHSGPALNGRYVVLLEVRDRLLPAGGFPGTVAAVDRVVVWIDNQDPTATINSVGGIAGCGDILLSTYVGTDAEIRGVAWDPPIVATAPQQAPNDNFGSYSLTYKKDGESALFAIPGATPNTRVPNAWPTLPASPDGLLAAWNIVGAIDHPGPGPAPAGKLARGERCAFVITLNVDDTTHVGDSGNHHHSEFDYAVTIINDL